MDISSQAQPNIATPEVQFYVMDSPSNVTLLSHVASTWLGLSKVLCRNNAVWTKHIASIWETPPRSLQDSNAIGQVTWAPRTKMWLLSGPAHTPKAPQLLWLALKQENLNQPFFQDHLSSKHQIVRICLLSGPSMKLIRIAKAKYLSFQDQYTSKKRKKEP